ncbi:MAG: AAA family ATPase [Tissierellales bacterium]|nr:AAA family ATPase [Tissierellales bacterium]
MEVKIIFPCGLVILVGENNSGKTAIIDALRFILYPSRDFNALRINEDDFRSGTDFLPIEISCRFAGLTDEDEVHFNECLVDIGDGKFEMQVNSRVEFNKETNRSNVKMWGGETESGFLPSNHYDRLETIYLQPLRDPERGLRPGQHSQVSRLINFLTPEDQHSKFETIASRANEEIRTLEPVKTAIIDINNQMENIAGVELTQKTDLIFSDPAFRRIISGLYPKIENLPFELNGLGYNNLIFTASTLATLRRGNQFSLRSILIEEPEAHLNPQLQVLLLGHLVSVTSANEKEQVQVIASSHSPILTSQAPIDALVSVHEVENNIRTVSMCALEIEDKLKKKLQRYLDATRGELFFARRILMVEGIAEALIIPVLADILGGSLKKAAVTVLNVDGINFNAFLPLFGDNGLRIPVAILTDGDAKNVGDPISDTASGLKEQEAKIQNLCVEMSKITFEHELARSEAILQHMVTALKNLHPIIGKELESNLKILRTADEKADAFLKFFLEKKVKKGQFAQELVSVLSVNKIQPEAVPKYIQRALVYLSVIKGNSQVEEI